MATLYEKYTAGHDWYYALYGDHWGTQTFTPSGSHTITSVELLLYRDNDNNPSRLITVGIRATDVDGHPTGLDLCAGTTEANTLPTGSPYEWREITLGDGYNLIAETKYAIVARCPDSTIDWLIGWRNDKTDPSYTRGTFESKVGAGDWTAEDIDCMFKEYGDELGTPTVTTQSMTSIATTTATGNGNITNLGDTDVTQHGHCWNTTGTPDIDTDSKTENGEAATTGAFTSGLTGLTLGALYYVRAYATNTYGTSYGGEVNFKAGAPESGEKAGVYAVVEERFHYVDAYGVERYIEGDIV